MHEDKQKICDLLLPALQATYDASDLVALEYSYIESEDKEIVAARFSGGGNPQNQCVDGQRHGDDQRYHEKSRLLTGSRTGR